LEDNTNNKDNNNNLDRQIRLKIISKIKERGQHQRQHRSEMKPVATGGLLLEDEALVVGRPCLPAHRHRRMLLLLETKMMCHHHQWETSSNGTRLG
jgi:hypothetical protein|tara:strand:+ start:699 stop:986 length:288 start_codon:yes stop_codon:yes gene_type:complete